MKTLLILLFLLISCSPKKEIVNTPIGFGLHKYDTVYGTQSGPFGIDTANICNQRGHICMGICSITDMYCKPYLIENDTISVKVYPGCNTITYTCARCGKLIKEKEKEIRDTIWIKK